MTRLPAVGSSLPDYGPQCGDVGGVGIASLRREFEPDPTRILARPRRPDVAGVCQRRDVLAELRGGGTFAPLYGRELHPRGCGQSRTDPQADTGMDQRVEIAFWSIPGLINHAVPAGMRCRSMRSGTRRARRTSTRSTLHPRTRTR